MDRKEKILAYMKSKEYIPLKFGELAVVLGVPKEDEEELCEILRELEDEGKIIRTKKLRYMACSDRFSGELMCAKNGKFGFVKTEEGEEDIYVDAKKMNGALHGDIVLIEAEPKKSGASKEGKIIKILERRVTEILGVAEKAAHCCFYVIPDDRRVFARVRVNRADLMDASDGDRVLVHITRYSPDGHLSGEVIKNLGKADSLKSCMEAVIAENKIKTEFDEETTAEAEKIEEIIEISSDRLDLRNKKIFTIDGETARDFDDAVSIEINESGNYLLGVHIADVSHYVTPFSALDREAYERGTSVYLPDRVIPMLPEKLSNGVCSLNPGEDRYTLSVFMEFDKNGGLITSSMHKAVINSKCRMVYERVNAFLEKGEEISEYMSFANELKLMSELADLLHCKRVKRGAIEFDFPEIKILTDKFGMPIRVEKEERGISNKMIEEFMLAANETVAETAFWSELPFVYRVHEAPSPEKIAALNLFLKPLGLSIKGKIDAENPIKPKALEQIMSKVKNLPQERVVAKNMLRSLMKAEYSSENKGHFGLASKFYCHFTSPIRRYPDLVIHRILKEFLDGNLTEEKYGEFVKVAAKNSSECEQNAQMCERDGDDLMKTAYMSAFVGGEFGGIVSGVIKNGVFVELENGIEGLVRVENLTDDYYVYDEVNMRFHGEHTGKIISIGDEINVVVAKCDLVMREIELVPAENVTYELLKKFTPPKRNRKERRNRNKKGKRR